jgi:hypothetical protein
VGVVREHEHGPRLGELSEDGKRARADEMALGRRGRREAERAAQGLRLRHGQPLERAEHGREERVQPGERELDLGLHAPHAEHGGVPGRGGRVLEQRRLADPRLTPEHEHAAAPVARPGQQRIDPCTLRVAAQQHGPIVRGRGWRPGRCGSRGEAAGWRHGRCGSRSEAGRGGDPADADRAVKPHGGGRPRQMAGRFGVGRGVRPRGSPGSAPGGGRLTPCLADPSRASPS